MSGAEIALGLLAAFRGLVDEMHGELARRGHPDVRPVHGFTLQAVRAGDATAVELGRRLGVTKQAAGKTVDGLVALGYVERRTDPADGRRRTVVLTPRGEEVLGMSAVIVGQLRSRHEATVGPAAMREFEQVLREFGGPAALDASGWLDP